MAEREKEVIVTNEGGGGGAMTLLAVVLLIALIVGLFFVFGGNLMNGEKATDINADIKIDTPAKNN